MEIKQREYDALLLLAMKLSLSGFRVFVGTHAAIRRLLESVDTPCGLYLDKSMPAEKMLKWLKQRCQFIWVMDAEISPVQEAKWLRLELEARFKEDQLDIIDKFLVVGKYAENAVKSLSIKNAKKVLSTGWPRLDLPSNIGEILYKLEIEEIKKKYSEFLLFASSFGVNRNPDSLIGQRRASVMKETPYWSSQMEGLKYNNFLKAVDCILSWDKIDSVPPIVVRPHVAESVSVWEKAVRGSRKTFIEADGSGLPWLLASKALIHQGSTMSIEAFLAGKESYLLSDCMLPDYSRVGLAASQFICSKDRPPVISKDQNPSYNYVYVKEGISNGYGTAADKIKEYISEEYTITDLNYSRFMVILSHLNFKSLRRAVGLIRDEIFWKLQRINIHPESKSIPRGLGSKEIKRMQIALDLRSKLRFRWITLNLWEFTPIQEKNGA